MAACKWYPVLFLFCILASGYSYGQAPPNDNCANAYDIPTGSNYAPGNYNGIKVRLKKAGVQPGESFPSLLSNLGLNKKTVWYKFSIGMRRSVSIELKQNDTLIDQNAVGFAVYKYSSNCPPNLGQLDPSLAVLTKFGSTTNTCLAQGTYLIQVCANNRAEDSIWINLDVGASSPAPFDKGTTAWRVQTLFTGNYSITGDATCLTVDSANELCKAFGAGYKDYNKTAWAVFKTDTAPDLVTIIFRAGHNQKKAGDSMAVGYILYEGDAANGSQSLKIAEGPKIYTSPCNGYCYVQAYLDYSCKLKPNTYYSIQLFFHKDAEMQYDMVLQKNGKGTAKAANPKKLPAAYQLGKLADGKYYVKNDVFGCNAHTELYPCGSSLPAYTVDTPEIINNVPQIDSFDLNTWCTFEVTDSGLLTIENHIYDCEGHDEAMYDSYRDFIFNIYKGDITKNCNLPLVCTTTSADMLYHEGICIAPRIYSYKIVATSTPHNSNFKSCFNIALGMPVEYTINVQKRHKQLPAKFYTPAKAENLGDISMILYANQKTGGTEDYAAAPFDTLTIDSIHLGDREVYREFYLADSFFIRIQPAAASDPHKFAWGYTMRLFSGKASDGVDKLKRLPFKYFGYNYYNPAYSYIDQLDSTFFRSGCIPLPPGWYTVVGCAEVPCTSVNSLYNNIVISAQKRCTQHYGTARTACKVNNLLPLTYNSGSNDPVTYDFPHECFNCESNLPFAAPACSVQYRAYDKVAYYVFRISQPVYAKFTCDHFPYSADIFTDPTNAKLFNFDISKDSSLVSDPSRTIKSCSQYAEYCNLKPGVYTLAIYSSDQMTIAPHMFIDSVGTSAFDHASQAGDMGLITGNGSPVYSKPDYFYCTTGAASTDPDSLLYAVGGYPNPGKASLPYPIPYNYYSGNKPRRTLWYTFTAAGTGHIKIQLKELTFTTRQEDLTFSVYKSSRNGAIPFLKLKASHTIDSTLRQGLVYMGVGDYLYRDSVIFDKANCDTARYFVLVDADYGYYGIDLNYQFQVSVSDRNIIAGIEGDHCSNAIQASLKGIGSANASVLVNCHSAGGDFGEDGSNMGCLSDSLPFKTTWFKVSFTATQRSDLTFNITSNTSVPAARIRYRVLYGDCKAMTPGPCIGNTFTSFTLNCMPSGDYYVQVAEPAEATGSLKMTVTAKPADYPLCKPANLFQPLANFFTSGGCNGLPVSFQNLSSQGEDITYEWDFGDGTHSSGIAPVKHYIPKKQIDTFKVKLTVSDTAHDAFDTLTQSVVVYRDPVTVNAGKDTSITCGSTLQLSATCNYPYAIFKWQPDKTLDNIYSPTPIATTYKTNRYIVSATVGGCTVFDTVLVKVLTDIPVHGSHFVCPGNPITLTAAPGYPYYYWNTHETTQSIEVDTPGTYILQSYRGLCTLSDTFRVYGLSNALPLPHDTTVCNVSSLLLNAGIPGVKYHWSTGDTAQYLLVNKEGKYSVTVSDSICSTTDTVNVHFSSASVHLGHDTTFCKDFEYLLDAGPADKYIWNTGDTARKILAYKPGRYIVQVKKGACKAIDSINIGLYPPFRVNLGSDTSVCDTAIMLDAGPGISYYWQPGAQTSRKINAANAGTYSVLVTDKYGCQEGDTIVISNDHCYPTLFVPNSFTPNGDGDNDLFKAEGAYVTSFRMEIFNRWGERIFKSDNINKGWDGRFKGEKAQMDVYLWMIEYSGYRTHKLISGNVTLLR
jgi:gliding motility-associated-like protein